MKNLLLSLLVVATIGLIGCESQSTAETGKTKEKKELPEVVTIENIGSLDFKSIDINDDGRFTYDEFDKLTKNAGSAEGNTVYAEYDVDGNGIITEEEFTSK